MRREKLYLTDIVDAADAIGRFIASPEEERFLKDDLLQSAVLQKLIVIGEASARLPQEFKNGHTGIPWSRIAAFRNILVHEYFAVDWEVIWVAATEDVPTLSRADRGILAQEYTET
jgi:uncharacterized protein with HEPN domain